MDGYDKYHTSFTSDGAGYNRTEVRACDGACYKSIIFTNPNNAEVGSNI